MILKPDYFRTLFGSKNTHALKLELSKVHNTEHFLIIFWLHFWYIYSHWHKIIQKSTKYNTFQNLDTSTHLIKIPTYPKILHLSYPQIELISPNSFPYSPEKYMSLWKLPLQDRTHSALKTRENLQVRRNFWSPVKNSPVKQPDLNINSLWQFPVCHYMDWKI